MRRDLQGVNLTKAEVVLPDALAGAIATLRNELAANLGKADLATGWTPAYSLDEIERSQTADFLIYSALPRSRADRAPHGRGPKTGPTSPRSATRRRPTPSCGPGRASASRSWRSGASFSFTIFWLETPDDEPEDPVLAKFAPLTPSQRKVGKYFLVVAAVLLLQIAAGTIMAHAYYDRTQLLRPRPPPFPPLQLLAGRSHPGTDHLDRRGLDRRRAVSGARNRGRA